MLPRGKSLSLIVGLVLSIGGAAAQTASPIVKEGRYWVQELTGELSQAGRLRVSATGDIDVRGASRDTLAYRVVRKVRAGSEQEAAQYFERATLAASVGGATASLTLEDPHCGRCGFTAEVILNVPTMLRETILATQGGSMKVNGLLGRVNADSAGGSIEMDNIGGDVRAMTASGSIRLGVIGGEVRCDTAGGSIEVGRSAGPATLTTSGGSIRAGVIGGSLHAETAGGGIEAERVGGEVIAGTSGGSIKIGSAEGAVNAETAGGGIEVARAPRGVSAETANGGIRLNDVAGKIYAASAAGSIQAYVLSGQPLQDSLMETTAGTIVVYLPADVRVNIDAVVDFARNLDRIESDFEAIRVSREDGFGSGEVHAFGALNGGGPVLRIRNTSGRIMIRQRQ